MTIMVPWTGINMTRSATGFKKQEHEASPDPLHAKGPARTTLHRGHIAEFSTDTVSTVYTTLRASPIFSASVGRVRHSNRNGSQACARPWDTKNDVLATKEGDFRLNAGRAWHDECRHFGKRRHFAHPRVAERAIQLQIIGYHRAQIMSLASPFAADWLGQRRFGFRVQMRRRAMRRSCLTSTASSISIVSCLLTGCDITIRVRSLDCDVEHPPYVATPP